MEKISFGLVVGFIFGILIGILLMRNSVDTKCQNGWEWKDADYTYSCTVKKRI